MESYSQQFSKNRQLLLFPKHITDSFVLIKRFPNMSHIEYQNSEAFDTFSII